MTVIVSPDELDAMIESGGVASSISANSLILKSGSSGPFSWTKSACARASFIVEVKTNRSRLAPGERPISVKAGHASSTYLRRFASAFGAGSVAITSNPRARYCAAQLAPMTPVPTIAMRLTGLSTAIIRFSHSHRFRAAQRVRLHPQSWSGSHSTQTPARYGHIIETHSPQSLQVIWKWKNGTKKPRGFRAVGVGIVPHSTGAWRHAMV